METRARIPVPLRRWAAVLALGGVLAGCSTTNVTTSPMGGAYGGMGGQRALSTPGARMVAPLSCDAPSDLPGERVTVTLMDMGMSRMMGGIAPMGAHMLLTAAPTTVHGGRVSIVVDNTGWRTHEVVVLPLASGAVAGQRPVGSDGKVDETGSLGEASSSCRAGAGDGIVSGAVGWVTLTLPPGHYELVCNLQNHYADGMRQELVVTG
ncbi:sulfocyanin-like copper-binding protein [Terrabacter carboxydivorans]